MPLFFLFCHFPAFGKILVFEQIGQTGNLLQAQKLIRHEAEHDALTDLLNKGSFDKILSLYKQGDTPYALVLADIDVFKSVNDTYGHAVGDDVLRMVANCLKNTFRSTDYIFRIGGDEFVVLVQGTGNGEFSENLAALRAEAERKGVSISLGSAWAEHCDDIESLLREAEREMYAEKERYYSENNTRR